MHRKLARVAVGTSPSVRTPIPGLYRSRVQKIDRLKSSYLPNEHAIYRVDHICASAAGVSSRLGSSGGHAGH
eukprot:4770593-Prymnesium_polylepis.1